MRREYLVRMRAQRNETQQDVADAIGISRQYYHFIEDGSRQKRMDIMLAGLLGNHFGVSVSEIFDMEKQLAESSPPQNAPPDVATHPQQNKEAG